MRPPSADRSAWVPPRPPPLNIRGTDAWSANVKRGGAADFAFLISSKGLRIASPFPLRSNHGNLMR